MLWIAALGSIALGRRINGQFIFPVPPPSAVIGAAQEYSAARVLSANPEGLSAAMTVTLSTGMCRMAAIT